ncbi:hypothetical protein D4Z78_11160, partial [Okeania hirsuta]
GEMGRWGDGEMGRWGDGGSVGAKNLSTVLKKMYFSIHFSPKKVAPIPIHNSYILSIFMLRKMFIKHSLLRG